jgi:integrase
MEQLQNNHFNNLSESDTITVRDVRVLYAMKERNELLSKYTFPEDIGGDGYFRIYVKDVTKKSGRKQLFAKSLEELQEKVYQYEKGILGNGRKTFDDVFRLVEQDKTKYIKDKVKLLSVQNTVLRDCSEYKRFFENTEFSRMYMDEISRKDIENIIYVNLTKYDLRIKGFASMKAILRGVFKKAYYEGWIEENQYERVDMKKFESMTVADVPINKRCHSNATVKTLLNYLHEYQKQKPSYLPAYALEIQILMGLRRGEVPPLEWADIDESSVRISKEQITVKKTKNVKEHFVIVPHTKTYVDRYFPISDDLSEFLKRLREVHKIYYPKSKYLFPADSANGVITNNTIYDFYRRTCKKLEIEVNQEFRKGTHSFRRNAITDVINSSGGNIVLASKLFGNSPEVAKRNYFTGIDMNDALECLNKRKFS